MLLQKNTETVPCEYCGRKFKRKRPHGAYCSDKCRTYAWNERNPRIRENPRIEEQRKAG